MKYTNNKILGKKILPVDIVLAPEWWNANAGIVFDKDFFFHPVKRVEVEMQMEKELYDRWGKYDQGKNKNDKRPEIGAVHLAAGFLLSEMLGCEVRFSESHPPQVIPAQNENLSIDSAAAFKSPAFKQFEKLTHNLKIKYNYLTGDVNWGGILNLALDLRGENIFMDMMLTPEETINYFSDIAETIEKFTSFIQKETKTTSISVNRGVRFFDNPVFLHSECSHTMISEKDYEKYLLPFDISWSKKRPFGIHYCGPDPHRMIKQFASIPHLDYLDVGWGGDIKLLRKYLPDTFFSIRLSPVELISMSHDEIKNTIEKLIEESQNPYLTGICCINMDHNISDDKIDAIFSTVENIRNKLILK